MKKRQHFKGKTEQLKNEETVTSIQSLLILLFIHFNLQYGL